MLDRMSRQPRRVEEPGYRRVAGFLRQEIARGRWAEDEPLPTDSEVGAEFGISRQTVRRAYLDLVNEGLVFRVPGRGTFITPPSRRYHQPLDTVDDLLALSKDTEMEVLEPLSGTYDAGAAVQLHLETRLMYGIGLVRRHEGTVFCRTRIWLPPDIGVLLEDDPHLTRRGATTTSTVIGALGQRGVRVEGAEQTTTARAATDEDTAALPCAPGSPLLHVERLYVDAGGRRVEWAVSDFLPDHYTHRLHLGRRPHGPNGDD